MPEPKYHSYLIRLWQEDGERKPRWRFVLVNLIEAVHAFSAKDNTPQSSEQVENRLEEQAQCFEQIAEKQFVEDTKGAAGKFRRQIKDVASIVDAWWLWTKKPG